MPEMIRGINVIEESTFVFCSDSTADGNFFSIDLVKTPAEDEAPIHGKTLKPLSHLAGDLAFLAVMMGKDNFSTTWCCWCRLTKAAWQESERQREHQILEGR